MSTSGRIHSEFLGLLYFLADKQASDYFTDLGYEPHKEEYCHRRGVYFHQHRCAIGLACAQAVAIRGAPHVARCHAAVPRALQLRVALDDWNLCRGDGARKPRKPLVIRLRHVRVHPSGRTRMHERMIK